MRSVLLAFIAAAFMMTAPAQQKTASGYHLLKTIPLPPAPGGEEYYDYITVDPDARRVYVSHGTEVIVLNADDYSVVGKIGGLSRSHGIALAKDLGKGFISDGDSRPGKTLQEVVFFDLNTLKPTGKVSTSQPDTDAIIYEPISKHVFTFNGDSHNATVIDAQKQAVVTTIDLIGKVEFPAVDGKGMIYDNNPEKMMSLQSTRIRIWSRHAGPLRRKERQLRWQWTRRLDACSQLDEVRSS